MEWNYVEPFFNKTTDDLFASIINIEKERIGKNTKQNIYNITTCSIMTRGRSRHWIFFEVLRFANGIWRAYRSQINSAL